MLSFCKRVDRIQPFYRSISNQLRHFRADSSQPNRQGLKPKPKAGGAFAMGRPEGNSEWWIVDGEIHEIGDNVLPRERFEIHRSNLTSRKRKQLREQFMRRTRLVLQESDHELWCTRYMELYQELRENWERLYWDEGYSKKFGSDHANYDSAEDDDQDFSPYRERRPPREEMKLQDQGWGRTRQDDSWNTVAHVRDQFHGREKTMREKAFAPMNVGGSFSPHQMNPRNQPFVSRR